MLRALRSALCGAFLLASAFGQINAPGVAGVGGGIRNPSTTSVGGGPHAPSAVAVAGCGAGTDNSTCGANAGTFDAAVGGETSLNACNTTLGQSTNYILTADVSAADSATTCFSWTSSGLIGGSLNLNGHTVTGAIYDNNNLNGMEIYSSVAGASVTCNRDGTQTPIGCITMTGNNAYTATIKVNHITVTNTSQGCSGATCQAGSGTGSPRALSIDLGNSIQDGTNTAITISNITAVMASQSSSSNRTVAINLTVSRKVDISLNNLTCQTGSKSCNAIQFIPTTTSAWATNARIHHNLITMETDNVGGGNNNRGIAVAGADSSVTLASDVTVDYNDITANNNDAIRFRQITNAVGANNVIRNVTSGTYGAYHLVDFSTTQHPLTHNMNVGSGDTIYMNGGTAFWQRGGMGVTAQGATLSGTLGQVANLATHDAVSGFESTVDTAANSGATRASNVTTIKTTSGLGIQVGDVMVIRNVVGGSSFNGQCTVTAVNASPATQISCSQVGADVGAGIAGGGTASQQAQMVLQNISGGTSMGTNSAAGANTAVTNCNAANTTWSGTGTVTNVGGC